MKTVYICEKCHAQYEEYEDALKCETNHRYPSNKYEDELEDACTWSKGEVLPSTITLGADTEYYDETDQQFHNKAVFATYKLVRPYTQKETQVVIDAYNERQEQEREEYERWKAEYEAKQARKAAEEAAKEETENA